MTYDATFYGSSIVYRARRGRVRVHQHDELIGRFCECGDGPFTAATWDDHRMALLGELPITKMEAELLDELDGPRTPAWRKRQIEAALTPESVR